MLWSVERREAELGWSRESRGGGYGKQQLEQLALGEEEGKWLQTLAGEKLLLCHLWATAADMSALPSAEGVIRVLLSAVCELSHCGQQPLVYSSVLWLGQNDRNIQRYEAFPSIFSLFGRIHWFNNYLGDNMTFPLCF